MGVLEYNGIQDDYSLNSFSITQGSLLHAYTNLTNLLKSQPHVSNSFTKVINHYLNKCYMHVSVLFTPLQNIIINDIYFCQDYFWPL